jgi:Putative zinc-finger
VTDTTDRFRDWDAAYVLGALDSEDRRAYERHLSTCAECSAAVAEFAGLPGILGKLSPEDAVALLSEENVPDGVDDHLRDGVHTPGLVQRLAVVAGRRRRRVRLGMLATALAVVALLAAGGVVYTANQAPAGAAVAMAPVQQHVITASMTVTPKAWGTRFDWSCSYYDDVWSKPASYDLVVTLKSGGQKVVGTWSSTGPHAAGLSASSNIATGDIRSVEIRLSGSTATLLRENL